MGLELDVNQVIVRINKTKNMNNQKFFWDDIDKETDKQVKVIINNLHEDTPPICTCHDMKGSCVC